ncbi:MAG: 5-oxoprolinase [Peptococcaceae bacterium BRH_c4a]|nr:MAG: 5-oxoprolinase [Peptococcaceae bacterium BRH_c4a]
MYRISIDVGGTFTDVVLQNEKNGKIYTAKVPSTPKDQSIGLVNGMRKICEQTGVSLEDIRSIIHGMTVATNAVLENKGACVGLITTAGFEHILHVARSWTPAPVCAWMAFQKPEPLADLELTRGAGERISAKGEVLIPLDEKAVRKDIEDLYARGVESLTVSLLNSYINPEHEKRIRSIAMEINKDIPVSISHDVLPEFREYERTLTTVMNAYVRPVMQRYLKNLEDKVKQNGSSPRISIVRSDGGLMSVDAAASIPVNTMLSGPSGGVTASALIGRQTGNLNVISFDMGGTSTDVALTLNAVPRVSRETRVGVFPVKAPSLDVVSIGAGGGSIAHVPITGALRVGPQSAGADPGPASYGIGGTEATVTDANVVLGYLPGNLAGGDLKLDMEKAREAVQKIADKLNMDLYQAAQGIHSIVNENMLGGLRVVSVEKGYDPRNFALLALGGAGPIHANGLGILSGSFPVIIPPTPGVLSALGFLQANVRNEFSRTLIDVLSAVDGNYLADELGKLGLKGRQWLNEERIEADKQQIDYEVDVRYFRQGYEIPIRVQLAELKEKGAGVLRDRFSRIHEQLYGFKMDIEVEIVNLRAVATGNTPHVELPCKDKGGPDADRAVINKDHQAYFNGKFLKTPVYDRGLMEPGNVIPGPAVVVQSDATTVILPGFKGEVDEFMNILINKGVEQ